MAPKEAPLEWAPFVPAETAVLRRCRAELGEDLLGLPDDLVTMLVRGYMTEKDPVAKSIEHMRETAEWRASHAIDKALLPHNVPAEREAFETMWRSAIIGEDGDGHQVLYESVGKVPPREFGAKFAGDPAKEELFLAHCAYNKELLRQRNVQRSAQLTKRLYKMLVVLDLQGLGAAHLSSQFMTLLKTYISRFSNIYPESLYKLYIIHAPWLFSGTYTMISPLIHPVTRAKIHVLTNPKYAMEDFGKMGVKLSYSLEEAYAKAPPLRSLAAELEPLPPPFNPPGEDRARAK